jgi:hypothetical protein
MRDRKNRIVMAILLSLVLFTSSAAFLMYVKQDDAQQRKLENVEVYVAAKAMKSGEMVGANDLKLAALPKSYADFQPLAKEDIIGKFLTIDMMQGDTFRTEKLSLTKQHQADTTNEMNNEGNSTTPAQVSSDTVAVSLDLFKNSDVSLKNGDFIDIVSVVPKRGLQQQEYEFQTRYIALHVEIKSIATVAQTKTDETTKKTVVITPAGVVLKMQPKEIKNFLSAYYTIQNINSDRVYNDENRGHLWMVKCGTQVDESLQNEKRQLLLNEKSATPNVSRPSIFLPNVKKIVSNNSVSITYEK